tara:strand:+ start:53070 stop:53288 length:219 start_codon:yes stop_codon:yes gene_type:complete
MAYFTDTAVSVSEQPRRGAAILEMISLKLRQRKVYNQTLNELFTLTQRDMSELGLSRGDFRRLSREAADMVK